MANVTLFNRKPERDNQKRRTGQNKAFADSQRLMGYRGGWLGAGGGVGADSQRLMGYGGAIAAGGAGGGVGLGASLSLGRCAAERIIVAKWRVALPAMKVEVIDISDCATARHLAAGSLESSSSAAFFICA